MTDEQQQRLDYSQNWFKHYWKAEIHDWILLDAVHCQWVGTATLEDGRKVVVLADNEIQSFVLLNTTAQKYLHVFLDQQGKQAEKQG